MIPTGALGRGVRVRAWVPIDDEQHDVVGMSVPSSRAAGRTASAATPTCSDGRPATAAAGNTGINYLPNTTRLERPLPPRRRTVATTT